MCVQQINKNYTFISLYYIMEAVLERYDVRLERREPTLVQCSVCISLILKNSFISDNDIVQSRCNGFTEVARSIPTKKHT